jgi:flagellar FliJ protein
VKKFSFELEKVLEFRDFERKEAEGELAKALAVENEIQNNMKAIAAQMANLNKYMKGSVDFADVISASQNKSLLNYQKEELLKQLAQAQLVTQQKREILTECMKKTTALEKMKEIQLAQYKEEAKALEKKKIEQVATNKMVNDALSNGKQNLQ